MKILFSGAKSGWAEYVMKGTKQKPRNPDLIKVIDGDINLTKKIYNSTNYKQNYTRIVLAFKGKVEEEKMEKVYNEFKELYFKNFKDEYDISAVIHKDTDNDHIHICVPKLNLKTGKANDYYLHRFDEQRANSIRDYLIIKHNLTTQNTKKIIKEMTHEETKTLQAKPFKKVKTLGRKRSSDNIIIPSEKQTIFSKV